MTAKDIDEPPPPTPEEARRALEAALAEIGLVFKKKKQPVNIKLEQYLSKPLFVDDESMDIEKPVQGKFVNLIIIIKEHHFSECTDL